jgi:hypothetical protein
MQVLVVDDLDEAKPPECRAAECIKIGKDDR